MIETSSSLACFRTCPKKYEFQYVEGLVSRGFSKSLVYGSFVHHYRAMKHASTMGDFEEHRALKDLEAYKTECLQRFEQSTTEVMEEHDLAKRVVDLWWDHWNKTADPLAEPSLKWTHIEKEWRHPVGGHEIAGKSDGVVHHKKWEKTYLYELKTATDRDREVYIGQLQADHQVSANIMGLWANGIKTDGAIYDIIWKPGLKLTKAAPTQSQLNDRIVEEYVKRPGELFQRLTVLRTDKKLEEYHEDVVAQLDQMSYAKKMYRNPGSCRTYGTVCPYFGLCMDGVEEYRATFDKKPRKHSELS